MLQEHMLTPTLIQIIGAALFAIAILHTFSTKFFERLANQHPAHAGVFHLLGEVEVVFGFWALMLIIAMVFAEDGQAAIRYLDSRNFTEPMFVFVIMIIAATRPILQIAMFTVALLARFIPLSGSAGYYFIVLAIVPLLGSFITEAAAMTLAALILASRIFSFDISTRLKYATLGVLFVNISIGGTLSAFAAPPILMVAHAWGWDTMFMLSTFGWKAAIAVVINALGVTALFYKELSKLIPNEASLTSSSSVPLPLIATHLLFLVGVVIFSHHPTIFMGLFLFFMGVAHAYESHQDRLILREGLLVAFFLAGLVVLGGQQQWWLQPLLLSMSSREVYIGATLLTAITDNAALTYLGSLVDGLSDTFKYALVAGAVTGGGLTIIANAPNPAGVAILRKYFSDESVNPLWLLAAAIIPTIVASLAFELL
jgi:uncharacterized membrane protein